MLELNTEYARMFENAVNTLAKYIDDNGIKSLVLGVSGGVDSALVAALAFHATKRTKCDPIPVIGRSITIQGNKEDEISRAKAIGFSFCDDFKELNLTPTYLNLIDTIDMGEMDTTSIDYKIAMGNIKARIRMIQLYHLAGINKGMVLSTDNLSELMVGFWTLHGDVGDYGMIQNLWKTEVYGLAKWIAEGSEQVGYAAQGDALYRCINAVPTDGLGITNSDLEQLGAESYEEVDEILINYLTNLENPQKELLDHPVIQRYTRTHFKRENPINIKREDLLK